jgi:hypothetical protein
MLLRSCGLVDRVGHRRGQMRCSNELIGHKKGTRRGGRVAAVALKTG